MRYALISPSEPRETGYRVAEVSAQAFEVADPMFWVECDSAIAADSYWYASTTGEFHKLPDPPIPTVE